MIPHRVPSPRELVMHTQSIIQNALIKKKLEEQRENFRKRQEQQQQQQQQQQSQRAISPVNSPAKQQLSPTPLAFTPTSVLRKMTAEKEPEGANQSDNIKLILSKPSSASKNNARYAYPKTQFRDASLISNRENFDNKLAKLESIDSDMKKVAGRSIVDLSNNDTSSKVDEPASRAKYSGKTNSNKDANNNADMANIGKKKFPLNRNTSINENPNVSNSPRVNNDKNNNSPIIIDAKLKTEVHTSFRGNQFSQSPTKIDSPKRTRFSENKNNISPQKSDNQMA